MDPPSNAQLLELITKRSSTVEKLASDRADGPEPKCPRSSTDQPLKETDNPPATVDSDEENPNDDNSEASSTFAVSEETKAFLQATFSLPRPVNKKTRRSWLSKFGHPEVDVPKLDTIIKKELPKDASDLDKKLSRLQNFLLDAVGPLVFTMEDLVTKDNPDPEKTLVAIQASLRILGNASAQFSQERRTKALSKLNPDLKTLVDDEDFSDAAPYLFSSGFAKKAKERAEEVECLRKASLEARKTGHYAAKKRFFHGDYSRGDFGQGSGYNNWSSNYSYNHRNWQSQYKKPPLPKNGTHRGEKEQ